MAFREGKLEVTSQVRSVPLGQKRKRGRPKALGNCLLRSPPNARAPEVGPLSPSLPSTPGSPTLPAPPSLSDCASLCTPVSPSTLPASSSSSDFPEETGLKKTTRKRKAREDVTGMSPVASLVVQARTLKSGLGASKPPKKKSRNEPSAVPEKPEAATEVVEKPKPIKCKKRAGTCKHNIVFNEHYDGKAWTRYANYVKSRKATTVIDPDYDP